MIAKISPTTLPFLAHQGVLHFAFCPIFSWPATKRQLIRAGAEFMSLQNRPDQRVIITDQDVLGGGELSIEEAVNLVSRVVSPTLKCRDSGERSND